MVIDQEIYKKTFYELMAIRSKHLSSIKCLEDNTLQKQTLKYLHMFGVSWLFSTKARKDISLSYSLQSTAYRGLEVNQPKVIEGPNAQFSNN